MVAWRRGGLASVHFAGAAKRQSGRRNDGHPRTAAQENRFTIVVSVANSKKSWITVEQ